MRNGGGGRPLNSVVRRHRMNHRGSLRFVSLSQVQSSVARTFLWLAVLAGLAACVSSRAISEKTFNGEIQRPSEGHARIYLYRPSQQGVSNPAIEIYLDERRIASLGPETVTSVEVPPGGHRVTGHVSELFGDFWLPPAEFSVDAGKVYYVYPITRIAREQVPFWKPFAVGAAGLVLSRGTYVFLTPGGLADVAIGQYWQMADENTPDAYVDRMKRARVVAAGSQ
jgi:hypothetical protein